MNRSLLALTVSALSFHAVAEETQKYSTTAELGVISTTGNTETSSLKGRIEHKQDLTKFRNHFIADALYKEDQIEAEIDGETYTQNVKTAEKYFLSAQSDYKLDSEHKGLFVFGSYEEDKFSGYEYQSTLAVGYSDRLFDYDRSFLDYSVGPGVSFTKTEDTVNDDGEFVPGEESTNAVIRAAINFEYQFSENAKFTQSLASDISTNQSENTKTKSITALTANINSDFALKASFTVDQNSHVPDDKKHADTQTAITLVYTM